MEKKKKKQIHPLIIKKTHLHISIPIRIYNPPYESSWFETENNVDLYKYIKKLFTIAKLNLKSHVNPDTIKGILVPHSELKYSGLCSASAYSQIIGRTEPIKRIILLCTNQELSNSFISTSYTDITSYNKLMTLKIDIQSINNLKPYLEINDELFIKENSFNSQLPFIETVIQQIQNQTASKTTSTLILPLLISNNLNLLDEKTHLNVKTILIKLIELLKNQDTILICASNLSYINGIFKDKININMHQNIRKKDSEILEFIYNILNGITTRNQRIDDILFIQNAPSCGTMTMYLFAKLLNMYSGGLDYSSSLSSSSSSSDSKSPNIYKVIDLKENYKHNLLKSKNQSNNLPIKKLLSRVCCYYTSLMRKNIKIYNDTRDNDTRDNDTRDNDTGENFNNFNKFNSLDLVKEININDISQSSVSYSSLIFTTQPYIEIKDGRNIENIFSQYEKIALIGLIKEQIINNFNINMNIKNKIPLQLILPINCQSFSYNLGVYISIYKDDILRACIGTTETNNEDFTILSNVKNFTNDLISKITKYKNLQFLPIEPSEFNKLKFNIIILNNIKSISINDYFGYKFIFGKDGLILKIDKNNKINQSDNDKYLFSLSSIDDSNSDIKLNKKELLESLCKRQFSSFNNSNDFCYNINNVNNIKLYYNEGLLISDDNL